MQSRPERTEAAFSSNTTWAGRTCSLQQRHVTLQPGHSPRPPGLCLREAAWPSRVPQGLSLVNPAGWPRRAGRNFTGNDRAESPKVAASGRGPAPPAALAGARAHLQGPSCPCAQGPTLERSALPRPFSSRDPGSPPCPLGRGRTRPSAVPPWPAPALVCKDREAPASLSTQEGSVQCPRVPALGPQEPAPLPALASRGGQRAQGAQHLAGNARAGGPASPQPLLPLAASAARTQRPAASTQAGRSAARVPRRRSRSRPLPHPQPPQPTGVPGAQRPCEQQPGGVASSSARPPWGCINAWSPAEKVDTVSTQASQGGRSSSGARARLPSAAGPGRPDSWAAGSATVPAARPGAGRRQVWGARPHPHRKQGAPGAASVGGVGGQARSSRRAGGVAGGLGKALPGWPHLHNKRSEMEALVQRAIYKIQSQPPLAPQPPALPSGSALSPSLPRAQPPPAQPGLTTWPSQARPFNTSPPRLLAAAARCGQASRPPQSFRSWERGPEVLAACPPLQQAWAPWARGQAGGGGRARSPSLCAPPPPGARAAQQVLRNVPRPGVRGGREASLQPASCLLPPARLPAGRGGQGRGQPSLPAAQGPLVWGLAKATRVWKGPGSRPSRPTPRCPGPGQTDGSEKWAGGCPR